MPDNAVFVIFGVTGDLAKRKLLPALYWLMDSSSLPKNFRILCTSRRDTSVDDVIKSIVHVLELQSISINYHSLEKLKEIVQIVHMDIGKASDYAILKSSLEQKDSVGSKDTCYLYYLAVPPEMFSAIVGGLESNGLASDNSHNPRLLIEKPFGYNYDSALELIGQIEKVFPEESIYRVDHYLAKETTQNIITFRFCNPIFSNIWNNRSVDSILITAAETIGVEGRANFYEKTGALRDFIQNHVIQLLALVTMEKPATTSSKDIHDAKLKLLQEIDPIRLEDVDEQTLRGQYEGYTEEISNPGSGTETYAALKLNINNDRWKNVPVLLRTGKSMAQKLTEITLVFKSDEPGNTHRNMLTIRIQPDEGIILNLLAKKPSLTDETQTVLMDFYYNQSFKNHRQPDAYERVLVDAIRGDKTLFTTDQEVLASWKIIDDILTSWKDNKDSLQLYRQGSWGPEGEDQWAQNFGTDWLIAAKQEEQIDG